MARNKISRTSKYSSLLEWKRWALWSRGCYSQKWQNTSPILYEERIATKDTSRPHGDRKIQKTSKRCTILARNEFSNQRHDIKMHHLLRAWTAKHERAYDPFSHTKQALGNSRHRLVHMGQIWNLENSRANIWRDKFTTDYLRVNLSSWNLSRIRATYQSYLHWVNLSS